MSTAPQHVIMVWQDPPPSAWPGHYSGACVKVTDGLAFNSRTGFSWATNYGHWVKRFGQEHVGAWSVAYPQDGERLGANIAHAAGKAPYVILDIEDFGGVRWSDAALKSVVGGVRRHLPHAHLGYTTYPTRAQAAEHHIDQKLLDGLCDFSAPQVYYPYQRDAIKSVDADNRHASWVVAPHDDDHWDASVKASLTRSGRVFYWRMGLDGWASWPAKVHVTEPQPEPPPPKADPLRPAADTSAVLGPSVVWTGERWFVTDGIWRREAGEAEVRLLVHRNHTVLRWGSCERETQAVKPG